MVRLWPHISGLKTITGNQIFLALSSWTPIIMTFSEIDDQKLVLYANIYYSKFWQTGHEISKWICHVFFEFFARSFYTGILSKKIQILYLQ